MNRREANAYVLRLVAREIAAAVSFRVDDPLEDIAADDRVRIERAARELEKKLIRRAERLELPPHLRNLHKGMR